MSEVGTPPPHNSDIIRRPVASNIHTHTQQKSVTEHVDKIEASKLGGTLTVTDLPEQLILDRKV